MRCPSCPAARDPGPQTNDAAFRCALRLTACLHAAPRTPCPPPQAAGPLDLSALSDEERGALKIKLDDSHAKLAATLEAQKESYHEQYGATGF